MSHQALYRKYRSKTFDEIIGQEFVVRTLKNQVISGMPAHAYLFCGIRGTGKTSLARILSRALNCTNNEDGNPCNKCESCVSILEETNINFVELDGASNNGVDEIRELREKAKFLPINARYKVYVIDEVHMLTKGAFNALLKILEEPPEYLVFMLATTEPQKIPATILSRCQRFDLKRISEDDIVERMREICKMEGIECEVDALKIIAGNADGAMRDALSILDRCATFSSGKITFDGVNKVLGLVSFDNVIEVCDGIINKKIGDTVIRIYNILDQGKDLNYLLEEIILYFRNLLVIKTTGSRENLIRINEDNFIKLEKNKNKMAIEDIIYIIKKLSYILLECKRVNNPRIIFEANIISLMQDADDNNLLKRIENIEKTVQNGIAVRNVKSTKEIGGTDKINGVGNSLNNFVSKNNEEQDGTKKSTLNKVVSSYSGEKPKDDQTAFSILNSKWQEFLGVVRKYQISLCALVQEGRITKVENKTIYIEYDELFDFHYKAMLQEKNINNLKIVIKQFLGEEYEISVGIMRKDKDKKDSNIDDVIVDVKKTFGDDKVEIK